VASLPAKNFGDMKRIPGIFVLVILLFAGFTLGTLLQQRVLNWTNRDRSGGLFKILLGDGRRLFANHFFVKADISFHSGYYPTIFDQGARPAEAHIAEAAAKDSQSPEEEEKMDFLGKPRDWIEAFGRHFRVTDHQHLEGGKEREILPWLKLSAELDPQNVQTYTVAAFMLRNHLGKPQEAEEFLREGLHARLHANPNSYEILFELGRLYWENDHDAVHARNVWHLAFRRWQEQESKKEKPDFFLFDKITVNLARLEESQHNYAAAIEWFEMAKKNSPNPDALQKQIDDVRAKTNAPANNPK